MVVRDGLNDGARGATLVVRREHDAASVGADSSSLDDLAHRAVSAFNVYVGLQSLQPAYRCHIVEYKDSVNGGK